MDLVVEAYEWFNTDEYHLPRFFVCRGEEILQVIGDSWDDTELEEGELRELEIGDSAWGFIHLAAAFSRMREMELSLPGPRIKDDWDQGDWIAARSRHLSRSLDFAIGARSAWQCGLSVRIALTGRDGKTYMSREIPVIPTLMPSGYTPTA